MPGPFDSNIDEIDALCELLRAKLKTMKTKNAEFTVALQNLTDSQVSTMEENPIQYFLSGYLVLVNSLLHYPKVVALGMAEMVKQDLITDINNAWKDQETGVPSQSADMFSIAFDPQNALQMALSANVPENWDEIVTPPN